MKVKVHRAELSFSSPSNPNPQLWRHENSLSSLLWCCCCCCGVELAIKQPLHTPHCEEAPQFVCELSRTTTNRARLSNRTRHWKEISFFFYFFLRAAGSLTLFALMVLHKEEVEKWFWELFYSQQQHSMVSMEHPQYLSLDLWADTQHSTSSSRSCARSSRSFHERKREASSSFFSVHIFSSSSRVSLKHWLCQLWTRRVCF